MVDNFLNQFEVKPFRCEVCRTRFHERLSELELLDFERSESSPTPAPASSSLDGPQSPNLANAKS